MLDAGAPNRPCRPPRPMAKYHPDPYPPNATHRSRPAPAPAAPAPAVARPGAARGRAARRYAPCAAVLAVTAATALAPAAASQADRPPAPLSPAPPAADAPPDAGLVALGRRVQEDCAAAGDTPASCRCMIDGLLARLSAEDARRFFLLTLEEPAGDLPVLSLEEVARFAARIEAAMSILGPQCAP